MNTLDDNLGEVNQIACSGDHWGDGLVGSLSDLFYETLRPDNVTQRVQICTYTLGRKNDEVEEFFAILKALVDNGREVVLIVNDEKSGTFESCSPFAKGKLKELHKRGENKCGENKFQYYLFNSKLHGGKILHAKLVVVDRKIALIGSANISKKALSLNYEIMLKVSGEYTVSRLSLMLDNLAAMLEDELNAK